MEAVFGFSIPDRDIQRLGTVGETVRYLWRRSCGRGFTLRTQPDDVCESAFVFHELRRLLITRGGVAPSAVRLEARLGDLVPSWYFQFWKQVGQTFCIPMPHGNLLTRSSGWKKQTTIKEFIGIVSSEQF
jgi:hypothetical protein